MYESILVFATNWRNGEREPAAKWKVDERQWELYQRREAAAKRRDDLAHEYQMGAQGRNSVEIWLENWQKQAPRKIFLALPGSLVS